MAIFINGIITPNTLVDQFDDAETTSLVDVIGQVKAQPDGELLIYINSPGGVMDEGYAIHDYLKNLGRSIRTIAINQCASIATVIFLVADTRITRCPLMIHNPWNTVQGDAVAVGQGADLLEKYEKNLEKFYSDRLGIDPQTISTLMQTETYISTEQALALGFATTTDENHPALALINTPKKSTKKMTKTIKQKVLALLGFILSLELTTADGTTITVEREDGDPQVGDLATPDGEHLMPDGSTIVVASGAITEIRPAVVVEPEPDPAVAQQSIENRAILDAVKAMGGVKVLAAMVSAYQPTPRESARTVNTPRTAKYKDDLNKLKNKQNNG